MKDTQKEIAPWSWNHDYDFEKEVAVVDGKEYPMSYDEYYEDYVLFGDVMDPANVL